ncbi:PilW family protein [Clostridium uliginosum]|uniref:Prepilin-type N-terminal cleavage/methylation domain-containing protein n=1 Tax=Clostridium uliginosum TaxID=119641 RepID=A0A1I1PQ21_9CLOT|nr:prepilin-type N-terminal cleavage/methylation domain-containing protein [Clostridium uliginosum]SFD09093.1 prepilin-type N-terminal cleavage/methylation domain-containing protein [Clostridium uliginosum]
MIKKKKGFTLVEMIIVMALTVVILGMVFGMFNTNNRIISDVDVKSTLQTEGQAIQENLSNIGMQAIGIESVTGENISGKESLEEIKDIVINSYNKDGKECEFKIEHNERNFYINGKELSSNVESIKISPDLIEYKDNLDNVGTVEFNILLTKKKGYSDIKYPVTVKITFRNKGKE